MDPREINTLHIIHVASVLGLIAATFYSFAGAPETRKRVLMLGGVAALLVLLTGLRLWMGLYGTAALGWPWVKLVCWLGISALSGVGYRRRDRAGLFMVIAFALAVTALAMVYVKPF